MFDQTCGFDSSFYRCVDDIAGQDFRLALGREVCADDVVGAAIRVAHDAVHTSSKCSTRATVPLEGLVVDGTSSGAILLIVDAHGYRMGI